MTEITLKNKTALVTGSSRGIGQAIAGAMEAAGARIIRHGREQTSGDGLEEDYLCQDLMDPDAPLSLIEKAFARAPKLDTLVCNAGSFFDVPFLEMSRSRWEQTMRLNLQAPYFLIQEFARRVVDEKRPGSVLVVASVNGLQAELDSSAYDISKGGLVMMTRTVALALAEYGIRVNALAPGLIRTPLTESMLSGGEGAAQRYERAIPMGRIGQASDCAGAAVFLCSDAASYVTGHVLVVDGGLTISQGTH
jgi:NAD(P)-dependent dehydrogenase (short-subunit alcohol dehydrogenase family)